MTNYDDVVNNGQTKKNVILDSQILTSVMNCARLTDFRFNHNFQSIKGKSNSIECGSIVHKYLEVYYGNIIKGISRKDSHGYGMTAAQLYITSCPDCTNFISSPAQLKPVCGHRINDYPGLQNTLPESADYKTGWKFVLQVCEEYYEFYKNEHWVPLEVETVKQKVLYEDDEIRIMWKAKLDLISDTNQGIYPIDHKTMKQKRFTNSLNNQFIGQCIIMDTRGLFINKIGFQKTLTKDQRFERGLVSYTADRLLEWQGEILPYWAKQLVVYSETFYDYFPPNFSNCEGKYGPCPFNSVCSSNPNMREDELRQQFIVGQKWNPTNEEDE